MIIARFIGFVTLPYSLIAMVAFYLLSFIFKPFSHSGSKFIFNQAISFDQTCNSLLNGNMDKTMSGRMGRHIKNNTAPKWMKALCKVLSWQDPVKKKHCEEVYEIEIKEI
ncbi:MAG: hypothetical protein COA44_06235 [Arcobacter sp.]|nr:MAG: hypothetical protein COA44_06235 [Arcobacter sp.]